MQESSGGPSLASQTLTQERGSGELPIVELFYWTQNRVVKECNNEVFVFITEWPYVTHSRVRPAIMTVCYVRPLSYKNKRLVIAFLDHPVLGAVEQLYHGQFTRPSLLREGLACEDLGLIKGGFSGNPRILPMRVLTHN